MAIGSFSENSTIIMLRNVPLDEGYDHTLLFTSISEQTSYFKGFANGTFTKQYYTRVNSNTVRIGSTANNYYMCNYIMFQNDSLPGDLKSKWFYGFINSVEYVNANCCEVTYTLDSWQTWLFQISAFSGFVVRRHYATDTLYNNIVPEPFEFNEYVIDDYKKLLLTDTFSSEVTTTGLDTSDLVPIMASAFVSEGGRVNNNYIGGKYYFIVYDLANPDGPRISAFAINSESTWASNIYWASIPNPISVDELTKVTEGEWQSIIDIAPSDSGDLSANGYLFDGIYSGCQLAYFNANDKEGIDIELSRYVANPDNVVDLYMSPACLITGLNPSKIVYGKNKLEQSTTSKKYYTIDTAITTDSTVGSYTPRNHKCYMYPYTYYGVDNGNGETQIYPYEYFKNYQPKFIISGSFLAPVAMQLKPVEYRGSGRTFSSAYQNQTLTLNGYPTCSWNTDAYKSWKAQNSVPYKLKASGMLIGALASAGTAGVTGANLAGMQAFNRTLGASRATTEAGINNAMQRATVASNTARSNAVMNNIALPSANNAISLVTDYLSQKYTASIAADISKGQVSAPTVNCAAHAQAFYGGRYHLSNDMMKRLDHFFDRYGYQTNDVSKITRNGIYSGRPVWYYLQMTDLTVITTGVGIPADAMQAIISTLNKGITFWHTGTGTDIGDYSDPTVNVVT